MRYFLSILVIESVLSQQSEYRRDITNSYLYFNQVSAFSSTHQTDRRGVVYKCNSDKQINLSQLPVELKFYAVHIIDCNLGRLTPSQTNALLLMNVQELYLVNVTFTAESSIWRSFQTSINTLSITSSLIQTDDEQFGLPSPLPSLTSLTLKSCLLLAPPPGIDLQSSLVELNLEQNEILSMNMPLTTRWYNMIKLRLKSNKLSGDFNAHLLLQAAPLLEVLDLSNNLLSSIRCVSSSTQSSSPFRAAEYIRDIDLSDNHFMGLESLVLCEMLLGPQLERLSLAGNWLLYVNLEFLLLVSHIKYLDLSRNKLITLDQAMSGYKLPSTLSLNDNMFVCDCSLVWIRSAEFSSLPTCYLPIEYRQYYLNEFPPESCYDASLVKAEDQIAESLIAKTNRDVKPQSRSLTEVLISGGLCIFTVIVITIMIRRRNKPPGHFIEDTIVEPVNSLKRRFTATSETSEISKNSAQRLAELDNQSTISFLSMTDGPAEQAKLNVELLEYLEEFILAKQLMENEPKYVAGTPEIHSQESGSMSSEGMLHSVGSGINVTSTEFDIQPNPLNIISSLSENMDGADSFV